MTPFPLWRHKSGQYGKRIRGRCYYFGTDKEEALRRYLAERDDLLAGRRPRGRGPVVTVYDLANCFLIDRQARVDAGEMTRRTWADYYASAVEAADVLGRERAAGELRPEDFARLRARLAERLGPVALGNAVQRVRTMLRWAYESGLIDTPPRFGPGFAKPAARVVRLARARRGSRLIGADDLRRLIEMADGQLRAMILLGINCGFGQTDCSELTRTAVRGAWVDFPRPKTGVGRRCPLWPETVEALSAVTRPAPLDPAHGNLVFLTTFGRPWVRHGKARIDALGPEFAKLCSRAGVKGASYYDLRRCFRTVADGALDHVAAAVIMGHHDPSVAGLYRQTVDDSRLERVANFVRSWLYPAKNRS